MAAPTLFYGIGVQFLLPKKYKLWGKVLTKKRLYDTFLRREEDYKSELTNHTTKINKLESWKKEIDDSIFRLNHFQNKNKDAMFVEYGKNRKQHILHMKIGILFYYSYLVRNFILSDTKIRFVSISIICFYNFWAIQK